ncbi:MAG: transposase [Planctomycetia bacterium]
MIRVRYVLPRHKAANWVGRARGRKSMRPGANGVVELSPFEFLDRLADLVPPPRKHRHRYHGVFAANHRLRKAITALAIGNVSKQREATTGGDGNDGRATGGCCDANPTHKPRSHDTSRIAWAKLMAWVGEEFPLECPACGGDIRLIAFITEPGPIRKILTHLGEPLEPPPVSPTRGPPTDWGELVQVHDDRAVFLHRFGSALNHHVHLHACVTDGVFMPPAAEAGCDAPPAFLPARPITPADLAALTERVRRRVIRWFRLTRLLDAAAAADILAWENSGFSVDASVRITLLARNVPSYVRSLEHLLRYCARPPFALERLSVIRGPDGQIARIRYVLPRHKAANWVRPGRKSTRPGATGVVELSPFEFLDRLADLVPPQR